MSDEDKSQQSPTLGLGTGNKRPRQEDTPGGHQRFRITQGHSHHSHLRSFEDDVLNTEGPETTQNRINSALDRLETLVNNATIENISQSTKDRTQALTNRPNGNDISKTLGKITEVLEKLTTQQENTSNGPTPQKQTTTMDPPQKRTFAQAAVSRKVVIRVPTVEEPPSLRYHPRRVPGERPERPTTVIPARGD